jgi:hypothetical protein
MTTDFPEILYNANLRGKEIKGDLRKDWRIFEAGKGSNFSTLR